MKKLFLSFTILLLIYPSISFSAEEDTNAIDQRISEIERRLEFIKDKEKEYDDINRELDRPKYKVLIRRERELKAKKETLGTELEELLKERESLTKELNELRDKKRVLE